MGVRIALDLYPADVTLPNGTQLTPTHLFIVDGKVEVYVVLDGKVRLYWSTPYVSATGTRFTGYEIETAEGKLTATTARDCGCGNPLKRYNPWPSERRHLVPL